MSKRKGLSLEEKRKRMLEYFYEKKEVFSLKELESHVSKAKGIVQQTVKEVLQSLVDDGLVDNDKIGSGNFYWALPSKAAQTRQVKLESLKKQIADMKTNQEVAEKRKVEAMTGREASDERTSKLARLEELQKRKDEITSGLKKFSTADPERMKKLDAVTQVAQESAQRWTDNILQVTKYMKNHNPNVSSEQIFANFELPTNFGDD
eukprot:TRINITY_DN6360_c0_g1_i1.p1 TRINITY_DN6360_c0_g1~~TRINITY_DN6360_c0_g1_i1.p1  ORF type:complete len:206 (+),score=44.33 TRINITY_DN6360_c0_g1_i1:60-677(+)